MFKRNIVVLVLAVVLTLSVVAVAAVPALSSGSDHQTNLENLLSIGQTDDYQILACAPQCPGPGSDGT